MFLRVSIRYSSTRLRMWVYLEAYGCVMLMLGGYLGIQRRSVANALHKRYDRMHTSAHHRRVDGSTDASVPDIRILGFRLFSNPEY